MIEKMRKNHSLTGRSRTGDRKKNNKREREGERDREKPGGERSRLRASETLVMAKIA